MSLDIMSGLYQPQVGPLTQLGRHSFAESIKSRIIKLSHWRVNNLRRPVVIYRFC